MEATLTPPKGLTHFWGSQLWSQGCLASHNCFCTCGDAGGHLTAALQGTLADFFKEKCLSTTTTSPSEENTTTSGEGDGSGGALDLLIRAFEEDSGQGEQR
ncbi:ORF2 [Anelloviridae sp.]|nr:ORF2 [Anelloviridae sp.]